MKNLTLALILATSSLASALYIDILGGKFTSTQNIQGIQYQPPTGGNPFFNPSFGALPQFGGIENFAPSQAPQAPQWGSEVTYNWPQQPVDGVPLARENLEQNYPTNDSNNGNADLKNANADLFSRLSEIRRSVKLPTMQN